MDTILGEMFATPSTLKLSPAHSSLVKKWGGIASKYVASTAILKKALMIYVTNIDEFDALAPEIKYLLSEGLDSERKDILRVTESMKHRRKSLRTKEENQMMLDRTLIVRKICLLFNRLRDECFPAKESGYVEEVPSVPEEEESQDIFITMASPTIDTIPSPSLEYDNVDEDEDDDVEAEAALEVDVDQEEDESVSPYLPELGMLKITNSTVIVAERDNNLLDILIDFLGGIDGVSGVFGEDEPATMAYMSTSAYSFYDVVFPPVSDGSFDCIISIPRSEIQVALLTFVIENGTPFMLYLPIAILDKFHIDQDECKLNMLITNSSSAWFIGNLVHHENIGDGGHFRIISLK